MISAVLDVNVLVAAILAPQGAPRQVVAAWEARRFEMITSEGIVAEIAQKLHAPHIGGRYGLTSSDIEWVRGLLLTDGTVVDIAPRTSLPSPAIPRATMCSRPPALVGPTTS